MNTTHMSPTELELYRRGSQAFGLDYVHYDLVPTAEEIELQTGDTISLFTLNGLWGYSVVALSGSTLGFGYASFLKFCKPYPNREAAILAACDEIEQRALPNHDLQRAIRRVRGMVRQPRLF